MNLLILGGNGYLGNKLVHVLEKDKTNILLCTRVGQTDISMLQSLIDNNRLTVIPATIEAIQTAMKYQPIDMVVNLVCSYGGKENLYNDILAANLYFPLSVLNVAVFCGVKKFLTIGTSLPDTFNMYSFSKSQFSSFGQFFVNNHGIDFIEVLPEMFYGADEPKNRFIPGMITKMLNSEEVNTTLGTQRRDIIAADDVIRALLLIIHADLKGYNQIPVGTGVAPHISELVDFIWEETGKRSIVNKGAYPMRKDEPDCIADTKILRSLGKWEPSDWKTGIKKMIDQIAKEENIK